MFSENDYENYLNGLEIPERFKESNGGGIPDNDLYGYWLMKNDNTAFLVGFDGWLENEIYKVLEKIPDVVALWKVFDCDMAEISVADLIQYIEKGLDFEVIYNIQSYWSKVDKIANDIIEKYNWKEIEDNIRDNLVYEIEAKAVFNFPFKESILMFDVEHDYGELYYDKDIIEYFEAIEKLGIDDDIALNLYEKSNTGIIKLGIFVSGNEYINSNGKYLEGELVLCIHNYLKGTGCYEMTEINGKIKVDHRAINFQLDDPNDRNSLSNICGLS